MVSVTRIIDVDIDEFSDAELLEEVEARELIETPDIEKLAESAYYAMTGNEPAEIRQLIMTASGRLV